MKINEVKQKYKIFIDLDGVLCDFEKKVQEIFGKDPKEIPLKNMWRRLAQEKNFYGELDWMPGGKEIWNYVRKYNPEVLTGVPMGNWAPDQKKYWCAKNLGHDVVVHTVFARDKKNFAEPNHILIDDTESNTHKWTEAGGIAIHYKNFAQAIGELKKMGL
jgi:hypothetical protein